MHRWTVRALAVITGWVVIVGFTAGIAFAEPLPLPTYLSTYWHLHAERDRRNPDVPGGHRAALFIRANGRGPVTFEILSIRGTTGPLVAGQYASGPRAGAIPAESDEPRSLLFLTRRLADEPTADRKFLSKLSLADGATTFIPGKGPFGVWLSDGTIGTGVLHTQPDLTQRVNPAGERAYDVAIYPAVEHETGTPIANAYLIVWHARQVDPPWEIITRVTNVLLQPADPQLPDLLAPEAKVRKVASGFTFVEGPAWCTRDRSLYFSDIPRELILRYADGKVTKVDTDSGQSNGLMFDVQHRLIACEHARRRVSRADRPEKPGNTLVDNYKGKRLNSPNDLWLDAQGGIYFTDPRYGKRDDLELDVEGVYYLDHRGRLTRIIDDLVRPNGIAISPDGQWLYVADNGAHKLWRYPIEKPGTIGQGQRIAYVIHPDGMTVDQQGRLFVTCLGGVWVLGPGGYWLGMIPTPEMPANCTFGGPDQRTLFITARKSLYAIDTKTRGWHLHRDDTRPITPTRPAGD